MKKTLALFLILFFIAGITSADHRSVIARKNASVAECPWSSDEDFGYTGELGGGDDYGCVTTTSTQGTESGAGVVSADDNHTSGGSNAIDIDADNEYVQWTKTHNYTYFRIVGELKTGASAGDLPIFEAYGDENNYINIRVNNNRTMRLYTKCNSAYVYFSTTATVTLEQWTKFEAIQQDGGNLCGTGKEQAIRFDTDNDGDLSDESWECENDGDEIVALDTQPTNFKLGVLDAYTMTSSRLIYLDDIQIWWTP